MIKLISRLPFRSCTRWITSIRDRNPSSPVRACRHRPFRHRQFPPLIYVMKNGIIVPRKPACSSRAPWHRSVPANHSVAANAKVARRSVVPRGRAVAPSAAADVPAELSGEVAVVAAAVATAVVRNVAAREMLVAPRVIASVSAGSPTRLPSARKRVVVFSIPGWSQWPLAYVTCAVCRMCDWMLRWALANQN